MLILAVIMKTTFGYLEARSSYHILILYGYPDIRRPLAVVYDSLVGGRIHLSNLPLLTYVWCSTLICVDGAIYLIS